MLESHRQSFPDYSTLNGVRFIFDPEHVTIRTQYEFAVPRRHDARACIAEKLSNRFLASCRLHSGRGGGGYCKFG
jgi:hypothetical protein